MKFYRTMKSMIIIYVNSAAKGKFITSSHEHQWDSFYDDILPYY